MEDLHKRANELFIIKDYEMALEIYDYLIENNYKIDIMYSNKSACFLSMKKYKNALEYGLNSVQINLSYSIGWGRVGYAFKGLKMYSESLQAFEFAYNFNNKNKNYIKEINFLYKLIKNKINIKNVFDLLLNNKILCDKLKNNKENILNNKNITNLINEVINLL